MLQADAARTHQLQGVEIDLLEALGIGRAIGGSAGRTCGTSGMSGMSSLSSCDAGRRRLQGDQLSGVALSQGLARLGQARLDQGALTTHQLVDARSQRCPQLRRQIEMAAQVEQRALLDAGARTGALHKSVGDVGLAGDATAGLGTPDEHRPMLHGNGCKRSGQLNYYGTTNCSRWETQHSCGSAAETGGEGDER